ncbi:MAG: hypothetical protein A7315_11505 [Candidatus Altiarchaeales archaeon WOR_SM1_79]|nr:MAG: hypothetical protein A7315_11505 [Candidatus Altiarchaeales archaeon WOR_SM1_79]
MEPNVFYMGMGLVDIVAQNADEIKNSEYGNEIINEIKQMEIEVRNGEVKGILRSIDSLKVMCEEYGIIPRWKGDYSSALGEVEVPPELLNNMRSCIVELRHRLEQKEKI